MSTSVYDVLSELDRQATSSSDKGTRFERLIAEFLRVDPVFADQFSQVFLWQDWPGREGQHDTGIDLVAVDKVTGANTAIQCKFYGPESTISKSDIDTFLSASGKEGFQQRIIVSTTDKWNAHAETAIQGQQIPVRRIGLADLEASGVDWGAFDWASPQELVVQPKKTLLPHQQQALDDVISGLATHDRGKLIMACGTGKTLTSLRVAERLASAGGSVLFLVPSISLLSQSLREWAAEAEVPLAPLAVCSDRKAVTRSKAVNEDISTVDLALPSTTNVAILESRLTQALSLSRLDDRRLFDLPVHRRGGAGSEAGRIAALRPDHLRRGASHHGDNACRRGRVSVRARPRRGVPARSLAALHDRHPADLRRLVKGQGRRGERRACIDGRREPVRAGAAPPRLR